MRSHIWKPTIIFILKLIVMFCLGYFLFSKIDVQELWIKIIGANAKWLSIALLLSMSSMLVSALRSWLYFREYGFKASKWFFTKLYSAGSFLNVLLPGGIGGDGYKILLLYRIFKFSKIKSLRLMLYERVNGFFVLTLIGLLIALGSTFLNIHWMIKVFVYTSLMLIIPTYLWGVKYILHDKVIIAIKASGFSIIIQSLQYVMYLCILLAISKNIVYQNIVDLSVIFAIASVVAILPISIGGIGLREITFLYGSEFLGGGLQEIAISSGVIVFMIQVFTAAPGMLFLYPIKPGSTHE